MKMKSTKVVFVAVAALLIFALSIVITGCGENEQEEPQYEQPKNCDVLWEGSNGGDENMIEIFDTYDDMRDRLLDSGTHFDNEEVREYAEANFKEKCLIAAVLRFSYDAGRYRIQEIEVDDSILTMYVYYPRNNAPSTALTQKLLIAGVDRSFVAGVTQCQVELV